MSEVFCNKCGFSGQADERGNHDRPDGSLCPYVGRTRPQPTTSVDAERVWREALSAAAMSPRSRGASFDPDQAAAAVIQAYGDARADAARREALEEAAKVADGYAAAGKDNPQLAPISAQMRYCAQRIRTLKGSQQ